MSCCDRSSPNTGAETPFADRHGPWGAGWGMAPRHSGACLGAHWRPYEIAAVVIGFFVFWPIGFALLLLKFAQRGFGFQGDMFDFARGGAGRMREAVNAIDTGGFVPETMRSTGNSAFDEWRQGELTRLEKERRKLAEAQREFAEHIDQLQRARDREEFDSFMRSRKTGGSDKDAGSDKPGASE